MKEEVITELIVISLLLYSLDFYFGEKDVLYKQL